MLRAYVMQFRGNQDMYLPLMEFAFNNSYQSSIQMVPFKALYRRICRTSICWDKVRRRQLLRLEIVQSTNEKINVIREKLKAVQDRQKSYVDKRRRPLKFIVDDKVFLLISHWKGILRFEKRGKLSPHYICSYQIIQRVGLVAYHLALPPKLSRVHDAFHVSMLQKYIPDPSHVLDTEPVQMTANLTYEVEPVQILDRKQNVLRNKTISQVKMMWKGHTVEEATWEREEQMRSQYPYLFKSGM